MCREISVSCSTDPDSALDNIEGGQQGHLFNIVVLAVATLCSKVNISAKAQSLTSVFIIGKKTSVLSILLIIVLKKC